MTRPRLFSIPPGTASIDCFIAAFVSGRLFGAAAPLTPEQMADALIFVPTQRAAGALTADFAALPGNSARLLPRIVALGDDDALAMPDLDAEAGLDLPPALTEIDRRLALFHLVEQWRQLVERNRDASAAEEPFHVAASRPDAFALAGALAKLMDETIIEDIPLARLAEALPESYDPERHDRYWTMTAAFLQIAAEHWPKVLDEWGVVERMERRRSALAATAQRLTRQSGTAPVVVFGSTGSVVATADLMAAVAHLPMGAVVLPGLDLTLDASSWQQIGDANAELSARFGHPQAVLKRTLARIGATRDDVIRLPLGSMATPREKLVSEVFRPAQTTALWKERRPDQVQMDAALSGITLITAADAREEALAIALALRAVAETPDQTAALVTPDRALARAVQNELDRWNITVADSAGEPLAQSPIATLARLVLDALAPEASAVALLAVLRHPLCRLSMLPEDYAAAVTALDIGVLRGRRLRGGVGGLTALTERIAARMPDRHDPLPSSRLPAKDFKLAVRLAERLTDTCGPLGALLASGATLRTAAAAHRALMDVLMTSDDRPATEWESEAGRALAGTFAAVAGARDDGPQVTRGDYAGIFDQLIAESVIRSARPVHPRIKIWGLLEARLLDADRVILGGLDEGVWPAEARSDPFLNRPMRLALGLSPPERRIGQSAHDIAMLMGARDCFLTRAAKRGGAPTVASRFLRRLTAYAGQEATKRLNRRGQCWLDWARALDQPERVAAAPRPEPRIAPALMPQRLSLTEVETLYRNPYAIFARRVLRLDPLPGFDPPLDARDKGTLIHDVLADYVRLPLRAGADAEATLRDLGRAAFAGPRAEDPEAVEFWWRRFVAFVPWFVAWDSERRSTMARIFVEHDGAQTLTLAGGHRLTLSTRADRLELTDDGHLAVVDYKTGQPPGNKEVLAGLNPQLTLTAALAARGAFPDVGGEALEASPRLTYLTVALADGTGKERTIKSDREPLETLVERQFTELVAHLNQYLAGLRGFLARRRPKSVSYADDYDHLARHLEWSLGGEAEADPE